MTTRLPSGSAAPVEPIPLEADTPFDFECRRDLACFTRCCRGIEITLSPHDVLRLRRRLGLSSERFLERHVRAAMHEPSGVPLAVVRMRDDDERSCPFVSAEGCAVYGDRPALCRAYPVGLAAYAIRRGEGGARVLERSAFLVREPHCLGHREPRVWTATSWLASERVPECEEADRDWMAVLLRRPPQGEPPDPRRQELARLALYDLDRFRRFVLGSGFLGQFEVDAGEADALRSDDRALLAFALRFVKWLLGVEETMKARPGAAEAWRARRPGAAGPVS